MTIATIAANAITEEARVALSSCGSLRSMHDTCKKLITGNQLGLDFDPKRNNAFEMPSALLVSDMSKGIRETLDPEQVRAFADAYNAGHYVEPIAVVAENGMLRVVAGFHRHAGLMLANAEGANIKRVWVTQVEGGRRAELQRQLVTDQGVKLAPIERARGYRDLISEGCTVAEIAVLINRSVKHVQDLLVLGTAEPEVQAMVEDGTVKHTAAIKTIRKCQSEGTSSAEELQAQLATAKANGSDKITPKSTNQPSALYSRKDLETTIPALVALADQLEGAMPLMTQGNESVTVELTLTGDLLQLLGALNNIRAANATANGAVPAVKAVG